MNRTPSKSSLPNFVLSHGQVLWVLGNLGFRTGDTPTAFNAYIKGLRRAGLPFAPDELGIGTGGIMVYRYEHVMELAVALALRAQAVLPRNVVELLASLRDELRPIYRRAYLERESGLGAAVWVRIQGHRQFRLSGVYLDLNLMYAESGLLLHTRPKALGPGEAIEAFATIHRAQHVRGPLPLSELAADIVRLAKGAPTIRRGRS